MSKDIFWKELEYELTEILRFTFFENPSDWDSFDDFLEELKKMDFTKPEGQ